MSISLIEEVENLIKKLEEKDIENILNQTVIFSEKPKILFYAKGKMAINGYLSIGSKTFHFEIHIYKELKKNKFTVTVIIGKTTSVKELDKVI